ncbi:MAG TPA: ATP phosphoribosyltransferase regulatory subunit [Thermoanaerobaculia bacterium]|nr:ATP phosphoribosyltransferase regulatory subunit [Thermoanaerobaculia bacterium]
MATSLRYPIGVRPLLMRETARRRSVESRIVALLGRSGFEEIVLPILDYADPAAVEAQDTYRFVDRDGELVAIRSDFTPMVARALSPVVEKTRTPLRVFYRGDVIRREASRLGANREMFQIGAEIVGDGSSTADAALLGLLGSLLRDLGVTPRIVYTDATIPERLAAGSGAAVRDALAGKRAGDLEGLQRALSPEAFLVASRLASGQATVADLQQCAETAPVAARLAEIACAVDGFCVAQLDDVDRRAGYYSGLRFRAYGAGSRVVAQGGRYDSLYGQFGAPAPAVGFTVTIDELEWSGEALGV